MASAEATDIEETGIRRSRIAPANIRAHRTAIAIVCYICSFTSAASARNECPREIIAIIVPRNVPARGNRLFRAGMIGCRVSVVRIVRIQIDSATTNVNAVYPVANITPGIFDPTVLVARIITLEGVIHGRVCAASRLYASAILAGPEHTLAVPIRVFNKVKDLDSRPYRIVHQPPVVALDVRVVARRSARDRRCGRISGSRIISAENRGGMVTTDVDSVPRMLSKVLLDLH